MITMDEEFQIPNSTYGFWSVLYRDTRVMLGDNILNLYLSKEKAINYIKTTWTAISDQQIEDLEDGNEIEVNGGECYVSLIFGWIK